jgi:hypothetical protein
MDSGLCRLAVWEASRSVVKSKTLNDYIGIAPKHHQMRPKTIIHNMKQFKDIQY